MKCRARFLLGVVLMGSWSLSSCASGTSAADHAHAAQIATQRAATTTSPAGVTAFKLDDARALADLSIDPHDINLENKLTAPAVSQTIYFGRLEFAAEDGEESPAHLAPLLGSGLSPHMRVLLLGGHELADFDWEYVGSGPARREAWAVLDKAIGLPAPSAALLHTRDGGASWEMRWLAKPVANAQFFDFLMTRDGHGRLTFSLDADYAPNLRAGLYIMETSDDGTSWSVPRFQPDHMIPADPVDDSEQPEGAKKARA